MISLRVNGRPVEIETDPQRPLLWVLRDQLGLRGTKYGCGVGLCGICTVLIDGAPNHACMVPVARAAGTEVLTVEGLAAHAPRLVGAWIAEQVPQCGYCQGGQLLAAAALLASHPRPSDADIDAALSGVLCRCGTYPRIRRAIHRAAGDTDTAPLPAPLPPAADAGTALNDFIRVHGDDTITLVVNHSEMGQGALANLAVLVAEELELPLAQVRTEFAPADVRYKNPQWGQQLTGGSSSVRGEWLPLRRHAAAARAQLQAAAGARWGVPAGECRAELGAIVHPPSGRRLGYGALAANAARRKPPRAPALKPAGEFRLIGRPQPRLDIPDMVTGRTSYGIDVTRPDLLVASVARCPHIGGQLKRFDDRAALAAPGVLAVRAIGGGVAVVAHDFWSATRGRELLDIDWQPGAHATVDDTAIAAALRTALDTTGKRIRDHGDARRVLHRSERTLEADYFTPYLAHATLEPMNCTAEVRADGCELWVGTQSQVDSQKTAARLTGLPKRKVQVHTRFLGGGFGRRLETDFVADAVELSKALAAPVQVIWTRADDLQHDRYRPAGAMRLAAALDRHGRPAAWFMRVAGSGLVLDGIRLPYAIAAVREEHVEIESALPTGAWRSVGASNNAFALECFIDELAHAAQRDPFEYRHALLAHRPRHRAVLARAAEAAGWGAPLPPGCGRGIAVYESFGSVVAQVAEVTAANGRLQVTRVVCAIDCGQVVNPDSVHAQMEGAIAMGLSAALKEEVRVAHGCVAQANFTDYPILTLAEMPVVETHIIASRDGPGGVGEPGLPPIAPAVANAVFAATGERLRKLPLRLSARG